MRKGHGSRKVPGVKLRPALTTAPIVTNSTRQPVQAAFSAADDLNTSEILESFKKPFAGVALCASGVSDKVSLFQRAAQLGAQTSSDLTDRVTHLICEGPGSAKYSYCVLHSIPIMHPSWIHDSYVKWLDGETVAIHVNADKYRLPAFTTVSLCITGIDDLERRQRIEKLLKKNGGNYVDVVRKDSQLSHLLCGPDRGRNTDERGYTPKMGYVERLNQHNPSEVHLVWEEWFWDCIEFKGILNEGEYSVNKPRPQRRHPDKISLTTAATSQQDISRSDLVSGKSMEPDEKASIKHQPEATTRLWEGLFKKRGYEMKSGKLSKTVMNECHGELSTNGAMNPVSKPTMGEPTASSCPRSKASLSAAFRRADSFTSKNLFAEYSDNHHCMSGRTYLTSSLSITSLPGTSSFMTNRSSYSQSVVPEGERNLFSRYTFRALDEANGPKLIQAIELRGGSVLNITDDVDFIIVRLASGSKFYQSEQRESVQEKYRTECWLEHCIYEERVCNSDEHPSFIPLRFSCPIAGTENIRVHISGLSPSEKTPTVRLIRAIGATVTEQFSRKNTHLLCPSALGPKPSKAREWLIPVVGMEWLNEFVMTGKMPDDSTVLDSSKESNSKDSVKGTMKDQVNKCVQDVSKREPTETSDQEHLTSNEHAHVEATEDKTCIASKPSTYACHSDQPPSSSPNSSPKISALCISSRPSTPAAPSIQTSRTGTSVPSSTTPSPLRVPSEKTEIIYRESATVLKDTIASLLGKRPSSTDVETHVQGRAGKRTRPPLRTKSKHDAFSDITVNDARNSPDSVGSVPFSNPMQSSEAPSRSAELCDSMRVIYEDPGQQDEKRKLLRLIENEPELDKRNISGKKQKNPVRRGAKAV